MVGITCMYYVTRRECSGLHSIPARQSSHRNGERGSCIFHSPPPKSALYSKVAAYLALISCLVSEGPTEIRTGLHSVSFCYAS